MVERSNDVAGRVRVPADRQWLTFLHFAERFPRVRQLERIGSWSDPAGDRPGPGVGG